MSEVVKVTALGQTYKHQGKGFGPFTGTSDRPFLEVPLAVALASGAPVYTGEEAETEEDKAWDSQFESLIAERDQLQKVVDDTAKAVLDRAAFLRVPRFDDQHADGMDVHQAVAAGFDDLKADLDAVTAERDDLRAKLEEADGEISFLKLDVQNLNARIQDAISKIPADVEVAGPAPIQGETPLPEDFPMRALLLQHGFDSLGKVRAGVADGKVDEISGIGPTTLKAIEAALK